MHRTLLPALALVLVAHATAPGAEPAQRLLDDLLTRLPTSATPTPLILAADAATTRGAAMNGSTEVVDAGPGVPFANARRVRVPHALSPAWQATMHSPMNIGPITKGHVILGTCWVRAPEATGGRSGIASIFLERMVGGWASLAETGATFGNDWRQLYVAGTAKEDFPANSVGFAMHLGAQEQVVDAGGFTLIDLGPDISLASLPSNRLHWAGMEADAPWRAEAAARIDRLRKGELELRVVDAGGVPLAAEVHLTQVRRQCTIGSFTGYGIIGDAPDAVRQRTLLEQLFDRVTIPIYWADGWGWPDKRDEYLALGRWSRERGMATRGHCLIYPGWQFMPAKIKAMKDDLAAFQAACLAHIREMGEAYRDIPLREIDVTNELRDLAKEAVAVVGVDGIAAWFAEARRAFPGVKLSLNENTILTNGGSTTANQDLLLDWYEQLKSRGQAPDVLGFQGHFSEGITAPTRVWEILDRFAAATAAEFQITEFDLNTRDDAGQAAYLADFFTACFAHPRITGITMWGVWEGDHWIPSAAPWRKDWSPRPAGSAIEQLVRQWRTDLTATTDPQGMLTSRVWAGQLAVEATSGTRRGSAIVTLPEGGTATVTVTVR